MGTISLKPRVVIGSDKIGKWDQEGVYMGISLILCEVLSEMLY